MGAQTKLAKSEDSNLLRLVHLFKASGDPLRAQILRVLSHECFCVQELSYIFDTPQPGISHHLKLLTEANLLTPRRHGNSIFYGRNLLRLSDTDSMLRGSMFYALDQEPLNRNFFERIARVYKQRAEQSRAYFQKNAEKFREQQGLICDLNEYLPHLMELLELSGLPNDAKVMEVGPGQGEFLNILAKKFKNLTALDNSSAMLELAKTQIKGKNKIRFLEASLEDMAIPRQPFDLITMNMVLHHTPSPSKALEKLRAMIKEGGYLLLAELTPHTQEWAKSACGDLWLGFDSQDLDTWARQAHFELKHSLYIGLKYGFHIQLKLFGAISL